MECLMYCLINRTTPQNVNTNLHMEQFMFWFLVITPCGAESHNKSSPQVGGNFVIKTLNGAVVRGNKRRKEHATAPFPDRQSQSDCLSGVWSRFSVKCVFGVCV